MFLLGTKYCDSFNGLDGHCPPSFKSEIYEITYQSGVGNVCWLLAEERATSFPQTGYKLLEVLFLIFWKSKEVLNQDMHAIRSNLNPRFFFGGEGGWQTHLLYTSIARILIEVVLRNLKRVRERFKN